MLTLVGCGGVGSAPINGGTLARVGVSVAPPNMTVTTGTTQTFTATVINTSETGVGWLVNGFPGGINPADQSTPFGTIDKNGNYTAPPFIPAPPTVTVTAVANADNSATANASVSINGTPSPVSIAPLSVSLEIGRTVGGIQQMGGVALFTATIRNPNPAVNWLVENVPGGNANVGTISLVPGSLNQVLYVAPQAIPGVGPQVHITAQSIANPVETASATINLLPEGGIVVAVTKPTLPPTLQVGQTQEFQASVTGSSDTTVSWQVDGIAGGDSIVGTMTPGSDGTAIYTAPAQVPNPAQLVITAISDAEPAAQASILANIVPAVPVTVAVTSQGCVNTNAVPVDTTVQFKAELTGAPSQDVTWQVNKITGGNGTIGTINATGLYSAPAQLPRPATVVVSAVSVDDPLAVGNQPITVTALPVPVVQISPISPQSLAVGLGMNFTATVLGLPDTTVAWNLDGGPPPIDGSLGTFGQSSNSGCENAVEYVAPPIIPTSNPVIVTAVASDGKTTSPQVPVTITAGQQYTLDISPAGEVFVMVGQTQPYSATEPADLNDSVTWSVSGKGCTGDRMRNDHTCRFTTSAAFRGYLYCSGQCSQSTHRDRDR